MAQKKIRISKITYIIVFFTLLMWGFSYILTRNASENRGSNVNINISWELVSNIECQNRWRTIQTLIKDPLASNMVMLYELPPLYHAIDTDDFTMVLILILFGANVNARAYNFTPLHVAALDKNLEIVKLLITRGAKVNAKGYKLYTPLHFAAFCYEDNIDVAKYLIQKGADVNAKTIEGKTPLHIAAESKYNKESCYLNMIKLLISSGADINARDKKGKTPLMYAIESGNFQRAYYLKSLGAKGDVKIPQRNTPSHTPAKSKRFIGHSHYLYILKYLLFSRGINAKDKNGNTPLLHAIESGNFQRAFYLISLGANVNEKDTDGKTALHILAGSKHIDKGLCYYRLMQFLSLEKADINARDKKGETPLLYAIKKRNFNTAVYLILSGADVNIGDKEGNTPLSLAEQSKNKALVRLLKKYGAR